MTITVYPRSSGSSSNPSFGGDPVPTYTPVDYSLRGMQLRVADTLDITNLAEIERFLTEGFASIPSGLAIRGSSEVFFSSTLGGVFRLSLERSLSVGLGVITSATNLRPYDSQIYSLDMRSDGLRFWTVGLSGDGVYEFDLPYAGYLGNPTFRGFLDLSSISTNIRGVKVSPDGTKLCFVDTTGDAIHEHALNTAGTVVDGSTPTTIFNPTEIGTNLNLFAFINNGDNLYLAGGGTLYLYNCASPFTLAGIAYSGTSGSISQFESTQYGLVFPDATSFLVCGNADDIIRAGTPRVASYQVATAPSGLSFNPNGLEYYVSRTSQPIETHTMLTAWEPSTSDSGNVKSSTHPRSNLFGLEVNLAGTRCWFACTSPAGVYQYDMTTPHDFDTLTNEVYLDTSSVIGVPTSLGFDDTFNQLLLTNNSEVMAEYQLSTAEDISTATHNQSVTLSTPITDVRGLKWDATKDTLIVLSSGTDGIYRVPLSTAGDISTLGDPEVLSISLSGVETSPTAFHWRNPTTVFVVGSSTRRVVEYSNAA